MLGVVGQPLCGRHRLDDRRLPPDGTSAIAFILKGPAGTIGVEAATFEALLTHICRSYKAHGFVDIILLGDSGGNQAGMEKVAEALNKKWSASGPGSTT